MSKSVDLSEDPRPLLDLLTSPLAWRTRVIEEMELGSATHVRVHSSYQLEVAPELLQQWPAARGADSLNLLIPIATREKRPLLDLDISTSSGSPAHLLLRASTAALQAAFLLSLLPAGDEGDRIGSLLADGLLEALCVFTPDLFRSMVDEAMLDPSTLAERPLSVALVRYLSDGLGLPSVSLADVERWRDQSRAAAELLVGRLAEPAALYSSSEEILLAVALLDPKPARVEEIDAIVAHYVEAVRLADRAGAHDFLVVLAEYGRRYELIIETEVATRTPTTVKIRENRPLNHKWPWRSRQSFALGDARSAHLEARVLDPSVSLRGFRVTDVDGRSIGLGPLESARFTPESLSLYSSVPERPYYVVVELRLMAPPELLFGSLLLTVLNVAAGAVALIVGTGGGDLETRLAVLVVPTTLAAAFALVREQTPLAVLVQRESRALLALSVIALWVVALAQLLTA